MRTHLFFAIACFLTVLLMFNAKAAFAVPETALANSSSDNAKSPHLFASLPVQHEGRLKPLDTYARYMLETFSGKTKLEKMSATSWLQETLFDPARAEQRPLFQIRNPEIHGLLSLPARQPALYSFAELRPVLAQKDDMILKIVQSDEKEWTPAQKALIELKRNVTTFDRLHNSLVLFLPLSTILPEGMPPSLSAYEGQTLRFIDAVKFRETLDQELRGIIREKGEDITAYTDVEMAIAHLAFTLTAIQTTGKDSTLFRVIPDMNDKSTPQLWYAPWDIVLSGKGHPDTQPLFEQWMDLAQHYHAGDRNAWFISLDRLHQEMIDLQMPSYRPQSLHLEVLYNRAHPHKISLCLYLLSMVLLSGAWLFKTQKLDMAVFAMMCGGALIHLSAIVSRIYILERPPVSTLYESIIFVTFIAVAYGLYMFIKDRKSVWLMLSGTLGVILHLLALSHRHDADSFVMLTAVLNTNFWLATHVLCITIGYALCIVTSALAHVLLFRTAKEKAPVQKLPMFKELHTTAILALLFCSVGTVLGGIWADQSWGRFWGWDPKENGALLIVLWLIWVLHGRISGLIKPLYLVAGLAYLSVIVALSWFGVNLLSVGLHSYGFTDQAILFLIGIIGLESLLVTGLLLSIMRQKPNEGALS